MQCALNSHSTLRDFFDLEAFGRRCSTTPSNSQMAMPTEKIREENVANA